MENNLRQWDRIVKMVCFISLLIIIQPLYSHAQQKSMGVNRSKIPSYSVWGAASGKTIPQEIIDNALQSMSEDVSRNIIKHFHYYATNYKTAPPDYSIYHYESLPAGIQKLRDSSLRQQHGICWTDMPQDLRNTYNRLQERKGEQTENEVLIRISEIGANHFKMQLDVYKPTFIHWIKKKFVEIFIPTMTLDEHGQLVNKYDNIFIAYGGFLLSQTSVFISLEGFVGTLLDHTLSGIYDTVIADQKTYQKDLENLWLMFVKVGNEAQARNNVLDESWLQSSSVAASERDFRQSVKKYFKQGKLRKCSATVIGFIIDSSGSMESNDPNDMRKEALEIIITDRLSGEEYVFLVDFDNDSKWINPGSYSSWREVDLVSAVQTIDSDGGTSIQSGLVEMKNALTKSNIPLDNGAIILLTDGLGDYTDAADWFSNNGLPVYTVSFVGDANDNLLTAIADQTGGEYMRADNAHEIVSLFNRFYNDISGTSTIVKKTGQIRSGDTISYDYFLGVDNDFVHYLTLWPGSSIELLLKSPSGTEYHSRQGLGGWYIGSNFVTATFENPEIGLWNARLVGASIPPGGEDYIFEVSGKSDLAFRFESDHVAGEEIKKPIQYTIACQDPSVIKKLAIQLKVEVPDGRIVDLGDQLLDYRFPFLPKYGEGVYKFLAEMSGVTDEGNPFQRQIEKHVYFGDYVPLHIAPVDVIIGNFVHAQIGKQVGNAPGLLCYFFRGSPDDERNKIARGYITHCEVDRCTAEIEMYFQNTRVQKGDLLMLDEKQWKAD